MNITRASKRQKTKTDVIFDNDSFGVIWYAQM